MLLTPFFVNVFFQIVFSFPYIPTFTTSPKLFIFIINIANNSIMADGAFYYLLIIIFLICIFLGYFR